MLAIEYMVWVVVAVLVNALSFISVFGYICIRLYILSGEWRMICLTVWQSIGDWKIKRSSHSIEENQNQRKPNWGMTKKVWRKREDLKRTRSRGERVSGIENVTGGIDNVTISIRLSRIWHRFELKRSDVLDELKHIQYNNCIQMDSAGVEWQAHNMWSRSLFCIFYVSCVCFFFGFFVHVFSTFSLLFR